MSLSKRLEEAGMSKPRVLVVDDEPGTVDMLKLYFEMFGFAVTTAFLGGEALAAVEAQLPDVIVLDLMLPDMDGLFVCKRLREKSDTSNIPVIMLSARSAKEDVQRGYEAGATLYLKKPVDLNKLLVDVKRLIAAGGHIPPTLDQRIADADAPASGVTASTPVPKSTLP
jgi:two-component system phosphate regulon response regulator PhoB